MSLVGHDSLTRDFKNLAKSGRLAHGYIFFGEPEVGKFYFAKHLAGFLENGGFEISIKPLQDVLIIGGSSDGLGQNGIDAIRDIRRFLWRKPAISKKRLVIINNAENFTLQAQNAILKITEEPPESSLLILIVNNLENLSLPLASRFQKIYFGRLSDSEMGKMAVDKKIIDLSLGRPGRAFRLLHDGDTKKAVQLAQKFLRLQGAARSKFIKDFVAEQKDLPKLLDLFFESLILDLQKNKLNNWKILRSVLNRFFLIKSYNTNKRAQLEAMQ